MASSPGSFTIPPDCAKTGSGVKTERFDGKLKFQRDEMRFVRLFPDRAQRKETTEGSSVRDNDFLRKRDVNWKSESDRSHNIE